MATPKIKARGCGKKRVSANRSVQIRTVDGQLLRRGCIVCCKLALIWEHSGIYVGRGEIIHLINEETRDDKKGRLVRTRWRAFLERMGGWNPARRVYVACNEDGVPFRRESCAKMAELELQSRELSTYYGDYSAVFRNCHHFSGDCLQGYREDSIWGKLKSALIPWSEGFSWLENVIEKVHGPFRWVECELES